MVYVFVSNKMNFFANFPVSFSYFSLMKSENCILLTETCTGFQIDFFPLLKKIEAEQLEAGCYFIGFVVAV